MVTTMMRSLSLLLALLPVSLVALTPSSQLLDLHASLLSSVSSQIPLTPTDYTSVVGSHPRGSATWHAESSPQFLTGVSSYVCDGAVGLDCWMGPSYDVPNCLLTVAECEGGSFEVRADLVARGADPLGSNPQILEKYYNPHLAWRDEAMAMPGAKALPPLGSFNRRLIDSPMKLEIGGLDFDSAKSLAEGHLSFWLGAVADAQQVAARLRGGFNLRDDKIRQFYYRGLAEEFTAMYGEDEGRLIASLHTGPVAEAYVGGGS
mmetsp:Transcript_17024/g.34098  ORF Transcript_17024/g.34098 Transcript_17024/m.34098 type:complete len:262 (-) Transcript_17024:34-819(-)